MGHTVAGLLLSYAQVKHIASCVDPAMLDNIVPALNLLEPMAKKEKMDLQSVDDSGTAYGGWIFLAICGANCPGEDPTPGNCNPRVSIQPGKWGLIGREWVDRLSKNTIDSSKLEWITLLLEGEPFDTPMTEKKADETDESRGFSDL